MSTNHKSIFVFSTNQKRVLPEHRSSSKEGVVQSVGLALPSVAQDGDHLAVGGHVTPQLLTPAAHTLHTDLLLLVQQEK